MSILKAVTTVGSYTGLSRILGLVREILISHFLGAGLVADAFIVAFKFPNFFRRFFGEGAFNAAFIPLFSKELALFGKEKAKHLASDVFSMMVFFLTVFSLLVMVTTPLMIHILAPGFATTPERLDLAVHFIRLTFPYLLFICLTALLGGVLNAMEKFANAAAVPIMLNLTMIAALLFAHYMDYDSAYSLCVAVLIAGILQFLWLYGACAKNGFALKLHFPNITPKVKQVFKLMGPGTLSAGVMQVNIFIDLFLASFLPTGALAFLYYADRLNQLPLSIFGIALSTALLPLLSKQVSKGDFEHAKRTTTQAVEVALHLTMPATVGLILLAHPIIALIYGHGKFDAAAVEATAPTLAAFALGLPAYVIGKVFSSCFFARQDTKTPFKVALVSVGVNIGLNLCLIWTLQHVGLALSTGISAWVNTILLGAMMHKRGWYSPFNRELMRFFAKVIAACVCMAGVIFSVRSMLPEALSLFDDVTFMFYSIMSAVGVYFFTSHFFGLTTFAYLLRRRKQESL